MSEISAQEYISRTLALCAEAAGTQLPAIQEAAQLVVASLSAGGRWWLFGTGHSHLMAEEIWGRAGGLVAIRAILEPPLMLHEGLLESSANERTSGEAEAILDKYGVSSGDVTLVASNSGRNAVPVEFARGARARGASVIALTSLKHSHAVDSRVPSGEKLFETANVVIDNCGVPGDAILPREAGDVGATSTVVGALLLQALSAEVVGLLDSSGSTAETYVSFNA